MQYITGIVLLSLLGLASCQDGTSTKPKNPGLPPGNLEQPGPIGTAPTGACPVQAKTFQPSEKKIEYLTKCVSNPYDCEISSGHHEGLLIQAFCKRKMAFTCSNKTCEQEDHNCLPDVAESRKKQQQHLTPAGPVGWFGVETYTIYANVKKGADPDFHRRISASTNSCTKAKPYMCVWQNVTVDKPVKCKCSCRP